MHVATPFLGAEALGQGTLNRHQLRTRCRRLFPGVYVGKDIEPTVDTTVVAAWLWSHRAAVVAGLAAAAMLGSKWVPIDVTVDLICTNTRPPRGIRCRNDSLVE